MATDSETTANPTEALERIRRGAAYRVLLDLYGRGEDLVQAAVRCSAEAPERQGEILVGLNAGTIKAPRLTSEGVAQLLQHEVAVAEYLVRMTPDPASAKIKHRPIPAERLLEPLRLEGYSVEGRERTAEARTHEFLSTKTGIPRRTIDRICAGTVSHLTIKQAEAILEHLDRVDLIYKLVYPAMEEAEGKKPAQNLLEELLEEVYERLWYGCRGGGFTCDESRALSDLHEMYQDWHHSRDLARLPFLERRKATLERYRERYGREPHPVPAALRARAERALRNQRKRLIAEEKRMRKEIGDPARITAATARDLKRRAMALGIIERGQRYPHVYAPSPRTTTPLSEPELRVYFPTTKLRDDRSATQRTPAIQ